MREEDARVGRLLGNVASALDRNDNSHRLKKIVRRLQEDARGLRLGSKRLAFHQVMLGCMRMIEIYCRSHMLCASR